MDLTAKENDSDLVKCGKLTDSSTLIVPLVHAMRPATATDKGVSVTLKDGVTSVNEVVNFVDEDSNLIAKFNLQTKDFATRVDNVTGDIHYIPEGDTTFAKVDAPTVAGYTLVSTGLGKIEAKNGVDGDWKNAVINVLYYKNHTIGKTDDGTVLYDQASDIDAVVVNGYKLSGTTKAANGDTIYTYAKSTSDAPAMSSQASSEASEASVPASSATADEQSNESAPAAKMTPMVTTATATPEQADTVAKPMATATQAATYAPVQSASKLGNSQFELPDTAAKSDNLIVEEVAVAAGLIGTAFALNGKRKKHTVLSSLSQEK